MIEKATFGAGCFWHVEEKFRLAKGVSKTRTGYMGGKMKNPTYKEVCTNTTGHVEVVEVAFETTRIKYEELLDLFWKIHNPTQLDQQGEDIGEQYKSIIFYHSEEQKKKAFLSKERLARSKRYALPIVTDIRKVGEFWEAEESHQKYLIKKCRNDC